MKAVLLFALLALSALYGAAQTQSKPGSTMVIATTAAGCEQLRAFLGAAAATCQPSVMIISGGNPAGSAVRFSVTYKETATGAIKTIQKDVDVEGGSAIFNAIIGLDFALQSTSVTLLNEGGTVSESY